MQRVINRLLFYLLFISLIFSPFIVLAQDTSEDEIIPDKSVKLEESGEDSSLSDENPVDKDITKEADASAADEESPKADTRSLIQRTLAEDIRTATYYELVMWCIQLGLDESGDLNALKTRLFNFYNITQEEREGKYNEEQAKKKIEIKSAKKTEYFSIEEIDENYLLLEGNVVVVVYDLEDNVTHQIKAHRIILNQTENILTAEEDIEYTLTRSNEDPEVFTGESFSFNINSWEGVFYRSRGETEKEIDEEKKSKFIYMGETISRLSNDTVILDKGTITSDQSPDNPYWKISAKKIWVLAPGEWAVQDLVLYIGNVPIIYFPFFFYPGDELFFHPVLGYKDREGNYIQTTTYLIGEKEDKDNPFSFLRITEDNSKKYKKEIKGLFLRTTEQKKEEAQDTTTQEIQYFKLMVDLYSRLGGFFGVEGDLPEKFYIKGGIAFSRNIYLGSYGYTVYDPDEITEPVEKWNSTSIFGAIVPFRYALETNFTYSIQNPAITVNGLIQLFSDPFFPGDFYTREENLDIASLVGMEEIDETQTTTPELQSTLKWSVNTIVNLSSYMPAPYIDNLSVSQCNVNINWVSKDDQTGTLDTVDPSIKFYYPSIMEIPRMDIIMSGVILTIPFEPKSGKKKNSGDEDKSEKKYGKGFRPPLESEHKTGSDEDENVIQNDEAGIYPEFKEPALKDDVPHINFRDKSTSFRLSYSLIPNILIEHEFYIDDLESLEDVDFEAKYTHFFQKNSFSLNYKLGIWGSFLEFNGGFSFSDQYQTRTNISEKIDAATVDANKESDYENSWIKVDEKFSANFKPFIDIPQFSTTYILYIMNWLFYKYRFDELVGNEPLYVNDPFLWKKDYVTGHSVKVNITYIPWEKPFTYSFYSTLPPLLITMDTSFSFYIWLFKTTVSTGINEVDPDIDLSTKTQEYQDAASDGWIFEPVTFSEELNINNILNFKQDINYNVEKSEWEDATSTLSLFKLKPTDSFILQQVLVYGIEDNKIKSSISGINIWGFMAIFSAKEMKPLTWDIVDTTWKEVTAADEEFLPDSLQITYNLNPLDLYYWKNRIRWKPSINSSLIYYFQNFTNSALTFTFDMDFSILDFLDLTVSFVSKNKRLYRYTPWIQDIEGFESIVFINPLYDLLKSFNFFKTSDREESAFNMESLTIKMVHHLYDWDLTFEYTGSYETVDNQEIWSPVFSIFVEWKPIPEIKKEITGNNSGINIGA